MIQKHCEACDQVITLSRTASLVVRFCYTCTEEFEDTLDAPRLSDAELDDWAKRCSAERWHYDN